MSNVLFINHSQKECGVHNYGVNTHSIISKSTQYNFVYAECNDILSLMALVEKESPYAIIYNYHPSTLGWINGHIPSIPVKQLAINHEPTLPVPSGLRGIISQDPSFVAYENFFKVSRPILKVSNLPLPEKFTVATFGFGFGNNDFTWGARIINQQLSNVIFKVNIPYAHFGDQSGQIANSWDSRIRAEITNPTIDLRITHDYKDTHDLVTWLGDSNLILFAYGFSYGRGCSSTVDFALAAKRPIAVSTSHQFKHFQHFLPEINFEHNNLTSIINEGLVPTDLLRRIWSNENLIKDYERILGKI